MSDPRPKVLTIMNRFATGGPVFVITYLINNLIPEFDPKLVSGVVEPDESINEDAINQLIIKPVFVKKMRKSLTRPWNDYLAYREIRKIIKEYKPDIVHTHVTKPGLVGRLAAYHENVPIIIHTYHGLYFHSYYNKFITKCLIQLDKYLAKISTRIVSISESQKNEIIDSGIASSNKVDTINLGFDFSKFQTDSDLKRHAFRNEFGLDDSDVAIAIVGRLVPIKDHFYFLEVLKQALQYNTKIKAFIVGDGELRDEIKNYANDLEIEFTDTDSLVHDKPLIFTSWRDDMDFVLNGVDILCLTSKNEGTPIVFIESQASGLPIVSTNVGGIQDVVNNGETAFLSLRKDQNQFVENLIKLVNNKELRTKMGKKGLSFVEEKFHPEKYVQQTKQLYDKLLTEYNN